MGKTKEGNVDVRVPIVWRGVVWRLLKDKWVSDMAIKDLERFLDEYEQVWRERNLLEKKVQELIGSVLDVFGISIEDVRKLQS